MASRITGTALVLALLCHLRGFLWVDTLVIVGLAVIAVSSLAAALRI